MPTSRESRRANKLARLEACRRAHSDKVVAFDATIRKTLDIGYEYFLGDHEDPRDAVPLIREWLETPSRATSMCMQRCDRECSIGLHRECAMYMDSLLAMQHYVVNDANIQTYVALDRRGNFKFGKARDPIQRVRAASTWFSEEWDCPRLLGFCNELILSESDVHSELQRYCSRLEWFHPCEDTFSMARRICQLGSDSAAEASELCGGGSSTLEAIAWYQYILDLEPQADVLELVLEMLSEIEDEDELTA